MLRKTWMIFSIIISLVLIFTVKAQEECPFIPSKPDFKRVIEGYDGKYLNLLLDEQNLPVLSFYDTLSNQLYLLHATTTGSWDVSKIEGGNDMENILLFDSNPVLIYKRDNGIYLYRNGSSEVVSLYDKEIKGISAGGLTEPVIAFYLLSSDHSEWELKVKRGGDEILVENGFTNDSLKRGDIISSLSTATFITSSDIRIIYTNLSSGGIKECILSSSLEILKKENIYVVPSAPFSAQWMRGVAEGEDYGVAFYHSRDSKLMVAIKRGGTWAVFYPLERKAGIGMYPSPVLSNGLLYIFGFDSSFGFASLVEEKDYGFVFRRIDGRDNGGVWISAVKYPPYDFLFAFSVPEKDRIEVHYLSDY